MSDNVIEEAGAPLPPPTSGSELAQQIGCRPDEGVIVALLTERIEKVTTREVPYVDKKGRPMYLVEAWMVGWGRRVLDLVSEGNERVKWWRVKEACDAGKGQMIPVRWQGPISEIPEKYFDPRNTLLVRFYGFGPSFFPLEKPVIQEDVAEAEAVAAANDRCG